MKAWMVLLFVPLAGCAELGWETHETPTEPLQPSDPYNETWYVTTTGLQTTPPIGTAIPLSWSVPHWLIGSTPPTFDGAEAETLRVVLNGTMHFAYRAEMTTTSGDLRPELTSWFGSGGTIIHHVFSDGPDIVHAGDEIRTTETLRLPPGGYVIPAGEEPRLRLASYYQDNGWMDAISALTGGDGTRVELTLQDVPIPAMDLEAEFEETISLRGGRCAVEVDHEGSAQHAWTVPVSNRTGLLQVVVDGDLVGDVDVVILGPGDEAVGRSQGPGDFEVARAWWTAIDAAGPGEYTVLVYACTPQDQDVDVEIETWTRF